MSSRSDRSHLTSLTVYGIIIAVIGYWGGCWGNKNKNSPNQEIPQQKQEQQNQKDFSAEPNPTINL